MTFTKLLSVVTVAAVVAGSFGCASQSDYNKLRSVYMRTMEQNVELEESSKRMMAENAQLKLQLQGLTDQVTGITKMSEAKVRELSEKMAALKTAEAELLAKNEQLRAENKILAEFKDNPIKDPVLNNALVQYAAKHKHMVSYDASRGMLKLRADLTFPLGKADLGPEAKQAIGQLAQILNTPAAQKFCVRVAGHTDNLPIVRRETKQKFHNNWLLSAYRAEAVRDALQGDGIAAGRTMIVGYGPYRPIAQPGSKVNNARNRRVEIYLSPMPAAKYAVKTLPGRKLDTGKPVAKESKPARVDLSQYK